MGLEKIVKTTTLNEVPVRADKTKCVILKKCFIERFFTLPKYISHPAKNLYRIGERFLDIAPIMRPILVSSSEVPSCSV